VEHLLSASARKALVDGGFTVIQGPIPREHLGALAEAYDAAVASADPGDVRVGSTTTRVHDLVNRGPAFDPLYVHPPVLKACELIIQQPFRLSTMAARTLRAHSPAQELHVDYKADADGWPMLGFIFMLDDFRPDNGATRFVPGSHRSLVRASVVGPISDCEAQVLACGPAGAMIVYNGSVWHGHSANPSDAPRRSIQGAYIRREAKSGVDLPARMRAETVSRIGAVAKVVLAI
jgi:hypothetical protein